jgi:MFS family permease
MSVTAAAPGAVPRAVGLYLAVVQVLFALCWIVYAIYLPQLAEQIGLPRKAVPWILAADQVVFIVTDLLVGVWSDKAATLLGRVGRRLLLATVVSALAFLALPWIEGSVALFALLTFVWTLTSSALRAPPLTLLGRYVPKPEQPAMVAFTALGLGVANALAPYVGLVLKGVDPRVPFALAAAALAAVTLGMIRAEKALAAARDAAIKACGDAPMADRPPPLTGATWVFLGACLLVAASFQAHVFLASAPLYLRHVAANELPNWMPVFWIGFNLALWPASVWVKRVGAPWALANGAVLGALAVALAFGAANLALLVAAQLAAGAAWALMLCSAFVSAMGLGHTGREGLYNGALQSILATAALSRLLTVAVLAPGAGALSVWAGASALAFALAAALLVWGLMKFAGWPLPVPAPRK